MTARIDGPADAEARLQRAIDENRPRAYDLDDPAEVTRLYREVKGYLHTCHYKHGTDWEGRKFAMDALEALLAARRAGP